MFGEVSSRGPFGGPRLVVIYLYFPKLLKLLEGKKRAKVRIDTKIARKVPG
jgi:hypothetical protein